MRLIVILTMVLWFLVAESKILDTSSHLISRQKRWLIWNNGSNWVQGVPKSSFLVFGVPLEVKHEAITIGTVMKAFYLLPTNSSVYTRPSIDYERRKRSTTRWVLYDMLEYYLDRYNYDGKACLLRTICEVSQSPFDERSGILAEIVQAVFTPSTTEQVDDDRLEYHAAENLGKKIDSCDTLFPECGANLMQKFTDFVS
ncbi:hypothetical protein NQ318_011871 [Aromia moschata]|uniref:Uncharacterized protein n=1 Tax=Aromia moschata TaxID=1265417 RepID=A0AAV8XIJ9_9CUCU|nr:hypothetical protein NQ318_011871 [Aromia moschata]